MNTALRVFNKRIAALETYKNAFSPRRDSVAKSVLDRLDAKVEAFKNQLSTANQDAIEAAEKVEVLSTTFARFEAKLGDSLLSQGDHFAGLAGSLVATEEALKALSAVCDAHDAKHAEHTQVLQKLPEQLGAKLMREFGAAIQQKAAGQERANRALASSLVAMESSLRSELRRAGDELVVLSGRTNEALADLNMRLVAQEQQCLGGDASAPRDDAPLATVRCEVARALGRVDALELRLGGVLEDMDVKLAEEVAKLLAKAVELQFDPNGVCAAMSGSCGAKPDDKPCGPQLASEAFTPGKIEAQACPGQVSRASPAGELLPDADPRVVIVDVESSPLRDETWAASGAVKDSVDLPERGRYGPLLGTEACGFRRRLSEIEEISENESESSATGEASALGETVSRLRADSLERCIAAEVAQSSGDIAKRLGQAMAR